MRKTMEAGRAVAAMGLAMVALYVLVWFATPWPGARLWLGPPIVVAMVLATWWRRPGEESKP